MAQTITITRASTANLRLNISPLVPRAGDKIYFTVKKAFDNDLTDESAVLQKTTEGSLVDQSPIVIKIEPEDTVELEPGKYVYDLVYELASGDRTPLMQDKFILKPAVTLRGVK